MGNTKDIEGFFVLSRRDLKVAMATRPYLKELVMCSYIVVYPDAQLKQVKGYGTTPLLLLLCDLLSSFSSYAVVSSSHYNPSVLCCIESIFFVVADTAYSGVLHSSPCKWHFHCSSVADRSGNCQECQLKTFC